ncbi:hypothetical protein MMC24_006923 [Lignoscripta atroalba]|nr:hypothetical protein [Lignoscripta atroalba]
MLFSHNLLVLTGFASLAACSPVDIKHPAAISTLATTTTARARARAEPPMGSQTETAAVPLMTGTSPEALVDPEVGTPNKTGQDWKIAYQELSKKYKALSDSYDLGNSNATGRRLNMMDGPDLADSAQNKTLQKGTEPPYPTAPIAIEKLAVAPEEPAAEMATSSSTTITDPSAATPPPEGEPASVSTPLE